MSKFKTGRPLFVDVGGDHGADVERLVQYFPRGLPTNTLILQELAFKLLPI